MLYFLFALCRRLHQPMRLAVVVTPLALFVCCALVVLALGTIQISSIQTKTLGQHGDYSAGNSSTGPVKAISVASVPADQAIYRISKATWSQGKSQLARRIAERWDPSLSAGIGVFSFESSFAAGPRIPFLFDASSPEYLTLRQLRL